jgi:Ribbon-helix-helix protein, copG family
MAATKKAMTLNLTDQEMAVLEKMCDKKELSKTALIKQALRLYQLVDTRIERGEKVYFEHEQTKEKSDLVLL